MNEARLPLAVRKQYGLVGRRGAGRARNWSQAMHLTRRGFREYKTLLRTGMHFTEAYQKALRVS